MIEEQKYKKELDEKTISSLDRCFYYPCNPKIIQDDSYNWMLDDYLSKTKILDDNKNNYEVISFFEIWDKLTDEEKEKLKGRFKNEYPF